MRDFGVVGRFLQSIVVVLVVVGGAMLAALPPAAAQDIPDTLAGSGPYYLLPALLAQAPPTPTLPGPPSELRPEKPPTTFLLNLRSRNYYDSWENDLIAACVDSFDRKRVCRNIGLQERDNKESGSQLSSRFDVFGKFGNFELSATAGYVDTQYDHPRAEEVRSTGVTTVAAEQGSGSLSGFTDTEINLGYNNFDQKTWGIELGVRANLPTGMTDLTRKQLRALPSDDVVTTSAVGEGFNIGPTMKLWKQFGRHSWYLGGRWLYLGDYDRTEDADAQTSNDDVSAGYEAAAEIGFNHPNWRLGYTLVHVNRGADDLIVYANILYGGVGSEFKETGVFWRLDGTASYTTVDTGPNSIAEQKSLYQDGSQGTLDFEIGYKWPVFSLSLQSGIRGSVNRDVENEFVNPTSRKLYVGGASEWHLFKGAWGTLSLNGQFRYADVVSSPAVDKRGNLQRGGRDDIVYDAWTVFMGLSYSFVKLF